MSDKMLQFVRQERKMPEKRAADQRNEDFREIYDSFTEGAAQIQASRCSQCGVPFCQIHCPLSNNIPDWLMLTANGRLEEAYELSQATNNFPEICGRICPQDRLCEGSCVIQQSGHETVTIGAVEKYLTDNAWDNGWVKPAKPRSERAETVAIIGAGPGGLAAGEQLRRKGYQVHIYDRYDRAGGLLSYGIPGFKLEKDVVDRRIALLEEAGIEFHLGQDIGGTLPFSELREKHDAVLVATGVYQARDLRLPGSELGNILPALYYLTESNRQDLGMGSDHMSEALDAKDKNVVVIGGGDTAMDCVRTAVRQGAKSVKCLYRRDKENMPGSEREVQNAEEEGVEFVWLAAPDAFIGNENVSEVLVSKVHLGMPDSSGRQVPQIVPDSREAIPADLVIKALGFSPENLPKLFNEEGLEVSSHGTLRIDNATMMTALDGVFAAGDIVRGASLVVWAIKDARDAADQIHSYIERRKTAAA
ncbi:NAD(P)-dependent oxidoreductase [Kiloniella sp.]|uniref:NAD(P)-dependent oxidoreductase n=1 Tax=Kiloniella sp. TaxID=1938587 RepID=UPI003B014852